MENVFKFFIISFIINISLSVFSQADYHWADSASIWHQTRHYYSFGMGYQKTIYVGDELLDGKMCQKFINTEVQTYQISPTEWTIDSLYPSNIYHITKSNDSVFVYRDGDFQLAFKTNAQVGEIWDLGEFPANNLLKSNKAYVKVDSVFYKSYNGISLRNIRVYACDSLGDKLVHSWEVTQNPDVDSLYSPIFTLINEKFGYLDGVGFRTFNSINNTVNGVGTMTDYLICYESLNFPAYIASGEVDCFNHTYDHVVGLNEQQLNKIKVYPNPSKNVLFFENLPAGGKMQVFNIQQQLVFQSNFTETTATIDVSQFANGMYFVQVSASNRQNVQGVKFVKMD